MGSLLAETTSEDMKVSECEIREVSGGNVGKISHTTKTYSAY